uniref:Radial spoke protein 8 n=1 Tax=Tetraselmis sp. GSL018 TaxID=582737 RepID=A0A061SGA4_9CHLO|mmetsp:Transcript_280/g.579  ORF Transcript_280/g.579 Transcript_280/m.579 type:complete len:363 (-) Transcript_280:84-1172(-)|eukprot:CAMPEP_0177590128 /NCGR_PEP_ID=MMETSP0419_2-20121207/7214_1 /TAXON_ID=582737 /ORGANISM="Tetraselmis sp., Strain GSL018" /LENGTH=362 /DNA_ID=CAMNT_0019080613 /DNA_START=599 /DNA_END=1687 /DNA_ORIENTATION=-
MQSHSSRHYVSEFLKDRHPNLDPPDAHKGVIPTEVAVAYGRRGAAKLVQVLALRGGEEIPHEEHAHCLRVLLRELPTQELKAQAVWEGAPASLVALGRSPSAEVRQLSCRALSSLCQLRSGRAATIAAGGIEMMTETLWDTPVEVTAALSSLTADLASCAAAMGSGAGVVRNLVRLIEDEAVAVEAKENAVATLEHIVGSDAGIMDALRSHVPRAVVRLVAAALGDEALRGPRGTALRVACASCLARLCHHTYGKVQVQEAGGIGALARLCLQGEWEVRKRTTAALMGITIEKDAKVPVADLCGRALVSMLRKDEVETAENARSALLNACEHPKARAIVQALLTTEELDYFLGSLRQLPPGV